MTNQPATGSRIIGLSIRVKKTADGEARPTKVAILDSASGEVRLLELDDATAELDFAHGKLPSEWRPALENEDLSGIPARHRKERKSADAPGGKTVKVPAAYDGLRSGDIVVMELGGKGDRIAYAMARRGDAIGAQVLRVASTKLKNLLPETDGDNKAEKLIELYSAFVELFYPVDQADRDLIKLREALTARQDAMDARIACGNRLLARAEGIIFCSEEGGYPEGSIEDAHDAIKANDAVFQGLLKEEKQRDKELAKAVGLIPVYERVFGPVEGCGPAISARLIAAIGNIRRFESKSKLKAFCGVHVLPDGRFPRHRRGESNNWQPNARQALYLLGDQFNRRPKSVWGAKLLEYKKKLREKHPEVVVVDGKKRYTDGHIHRMALWRTITKFVEHLHREWWKLENEKSPETVAKAA